MTMNCDLDRKVLGKLEMCLMVDILRLIEEYIISLDPPTPSLRPIELQPREPYPKEPKPREP